MADDGDKKNYANLHYPGMHVDLNEGKLSVDPEAQWRFERQIECIGEDAQKNLMRRSAFLTPASPLCVRVAEKLSGMGIGRIGLLGERELGGAHGLAHPLPEEKQGTLPNLAKRIRSVSPWVVFESFRETSVDRQASDMVRGFDYVIGAGTDPRSVGAALTLAREEKLPAIVAVVSGRQGWCATVPVGAICEDCLEAPVLETDGEPVFYPALELASTWIAALVVDMALGHEPRGAFIESFDSGTSPWMRETRGLSPKHGCKKCKAPK